MADVGIVFHLEDSNRVGIWKSHLDDLRILGLAYNITKWRVIDQTLDGYMGHMGDASADYARHQTLEDWWTAEGSSALEVIGLETLADITSAGQTGTALPAFTHPTAAGDVFYVIGPSNGIDPSWIDSNKTWVYLPTGGGVGIHGEFVLTLTVGHRYFQVDLGG